MTKFGRLAHLFVFLVFACLSWSCQPVSAAVTINIAFPGGNALVDKNEGGMVLLRPDLRGGKPWFYWYFEATSSQPGRATFSFPANCIGVNGPAVSVDDGKTWRWMGIEKVTVTPADAATKTPGRESFDWGFSKANERVRFSIGIPYVQSNLHAFLATQAMNPLLARSVLTKSLKGRSVEFLQIGQPGAGKRGLLLTARHHACEALASYVMEGFLKEALSDSPAATRFREKYVLYAVPFVDKDGVEDGDQGKNRDPHDHNRDYGDAPLYPEIKAIQEFAAKTPIQVSLDLHCPALKGDIHEAFHFLGLGLPHVKNNLDELIAWMDEERPPAVMAPINYLVDGTKPNSANIAINSHYFAVRKEALLAATLEIPYTQPGTKLDADMARSYGAGMLRALNRPEFITAEPGSIRSMERADLVALRKKFGPAFRSKTEEYETLAKGYIDDPKASPVYRAEGNIMLAQIRNFQKRNPEAVVFTEAVLKDGNATTTQRIAALQARQRILAMDAKTEPAVFEAALAEAIGTPYLSNLQQFGLYTSAVDYYQARGEYETAVGYGRKVVPVAATWEKARTLLRIASLYDLARQTDKATATRREAIEFLKPIVLPKGPRSSMGAMMAADYFDAVNGIPTSTPEERQAAADVPLNHDVVAVGVKNRIRKDLAGPPPAAVP